MKKLFLIIYTLFMFFLSSCSSSRSYEPEEEPEFMASLDMESAIKPKKTPFILIDPGHGGEDLGTHSNSHPSYQEKQMTLQTAQLLRDYFKQLGYSVSLIREKDTTISLKDRVKMANHMQPKIFISLHFNSASNKRAEGIEVFYYQQPKNQNRAESSKLLGSSVLNKVIKHTHAKSRGVKHGNFAVIRETTMPAILVEGGFLTNQKERSHLQDPMYLKKISWGIAEGVINWVQTHKNIVTNTKSS